MGVMTRRAAAGSLLSAVLSLTLHAAWAQQPPTVRISGSIVAVDGPVLTVNAGEAGNVKVKLADKAAVFGVIKAALADIKPGAFVGVGAKPQADGSQRAIRIMIFAEVAARHSARATGRGIGRHHHDQRHRRYDGRQRRWPGADGQVQGRREEDHRRAGTL